MTPEQSVSVSQPILQHAERIHVRNPLYVVGQSYFVGCRSEGGFQPLIVLGEQQAMIAVPSAYPADRRHGRSQQSNRDVLAICMLSNSVRQIGLAGFVKMWGGD